MMPTALQIDAFKHEIMENAIKTKRQNNKQIILGHMWTHSAIFVVFCSFWETTQMNKLQMEVSVANFQATNWIAETGRSTMQSQAADAR